MSFGGYALFPLPLNIQMPQRAQLPYSLYSLSGPLAVKQPTQARLASERQNHVSPICTRHIHGAA